MENLYGSICVSDIDKTQIYESKNGKKYLNIEVKEMKQPGKYGDTYFIKISAKQREEAKNYIIGNLKPSKFNNTAPTSVDSDDISF